MNKVRKKQKKKTLSPFRQRVFFAISHEHNDNFSLKQKCQTNGRLSQNQSVFLKKSKFGSQNKIPKEQWEKLNRKYYCQIKKKEKKLKMHYFC